MKFGEHIREKREAMKLSREALAEAIDVSYTHLRNIERECRNPPREPIVIRLAQVLQLDKDKLIALANTERPAKRTISGETRQKIQAARQGWKDSPETRLKKCANLVRARARLAQMRRAGIA